MLSVLVGPRAISLLLALTTLANVEWKRFRAQWELVVMGACSQCCRSVTVRDGLDSYRYSDWGVMRFNTVLLSRTKRYQRGALRLTLNEPGA
jgi:hypothetical protein